jgi:hypothetical protein
VGSWRAVIFVWAQALACYHPSVGLDMPCSMNGDCPTGQSCDMAQMECVVPGTAFDSGVVDTAAPVDTPQDGSAPVDAGIPSIAFRQAVNDKPSGSDVSLSLTHPVQAGDAIVMCLNFAADTGTKLTAVTDSLGNSYDIVVNTFFGDGEAHYVAAAYGSPGGHDTLTLQLDGSVGSGGTDWFVLEYAGLLGSDAFDASAAQTGSGTMMQSGVATTHYDNELLLGYAEAPSASPAGNYTERATQSGNLVEDEVSGSAGMHGAIATTTAGSWTMILTTFRGF